MAAKLKQQVTDLLLGDKDILKSIAEAVSTLIVDKITNNEETLDLIASNVAKNPAFINAVKLQNAEKEAMKQELYESLSFDYNTLKINQKELEKTCSELGEKNKLLEWDLDSMEQYGRRNCLLFHGIAEPPLSDSNREDTDATVLDIMTDKLGLEFDNTDLDRSHRIGRKSQRSGKPRPIIVKFVTYNSRAEVFRKKRGLKNTGLGISESLTRKRVDLYNSVSSHPNAAATWTMDGRIVALRCDTERKVYLESPKDLHKLTDD